MPARILPFRILLVIPFVLFTILTGCSGGSGNSSAGSAPRAPGPAVVSVSPSSVPIGSPAFTLSITGSNFQSQSVVNWNTTALATTYISSSTLSASVPANLVAAGVIANITVNNPDGQASTGSATSQQVSVTNPAPTLSTVSPQSLFAGALDTTFTLTGTNFNSSSVVMAGTTALTTTLVSSTQLTAVAPAALLAPVGTLGFAVSNSAPGGGISQSVPVTLKQPPAKLASLSPSSATLGASPVNVTLTGSYFTPTAIVYINNFLATATTFVSSTSIQFTIPTQALGATGNLVIAVRDPASQNIFSNALTFPIVNPVPVLNSISPGTVTAGAPNFTLTLSGSNFVSSATILINGTPTQPNLYPSATSAAVIVPASAVSSVGTVTIAVSNPAPGGGVSASQTLNVISANNRIRTLNLEAADLGWDSAHNLLIASTLSGSANNPNSIVTIDPLQGTVATSQSLPSQPAGISVTSDGSYVYVTLPTTGQIERFTLPSLTPDITFGLGNDSNGKFYLAKYVSAAPGQPHVVAITRQSSITQGGNGGVVVYEDGVPRSNIVIPAYPNDFYSTLTWGGDATTFYGTDSVILPGGEDTFSVDSSGVTLLNEKPAALGQIVAFDTKTGRLVDSLGNVVDAATGQHVGQLQLPNSSIYDNPFAMDSTQRIAFYLINYPNNPPNGTYIEAASLDNFSYINSMLVEGLYGGSTIVRWGTGGLAVNGSSHIYLIDGSFVAPSGVSSPVGSYAATSPTLTSVSPAAVPAGRPDVQVTLTGRDFTQASVVTWNNQTPLIDSISDTQIVATIPASWLTNPVANAIVVTNGPGTGSSASLGFTVLPNLGPGTQIMALDLAGRDLVWDSTRSLLYVAVPANDPTYPNTIAVIDPTKPAINQMIPVADDPTAISLSDDGQYLYSGSYQQAIVQRYSLPSFSLNLSIPTGAGLPANQAGITRSCSFPIDVRVAPGDPQLIAVSQGNSAIEPKACGGLAIYDNANPRPGTLTFNAGNGDFTTLEWGADASTLFSQSDPGIQGQSLHDLAVSPSGVTIAGTLNTGNLTISLGNRVHFDATTKLLYSDSGVITNPVGPAQVGKFSAGGLVVTDATLMRAFVLTSTSTSFPGQPGSYALDIFDLNSQTLLNSIPIASVLGYPQRMVRWGTNGLAFVTNVQPTTTGPAVLFILQGSSISGTP